MLIDSVRCEVLNASYEPLSIVSGRRGLNLCLMGKATIVNEHPSLVMQSGRSYHAVPTTILLKEMVKSRSMTRSVAKLTPRNLQIRDRYTCNYCGRHRSELREGDFLTRDHVHPQDKGGPDIWTNVVLACNRCNNKKGNRFLKELEMTLPIKPYAPTVFEIWQKAASKHRRRKG